MNTEIQTENRIEKQIAELVRAQGGSTYYVGGYVRDCLLGIDNKDVDIEVHGISPEALLSILRQVGKPRAFGVSFGIYSLDGYDLDIAMPRTERATGSGHRDFEVAVEPFLGTFEAARRRDFTINALMQDVLTGEIIDHFGGWEDLRNGVIRHVDDSSFPEDPLRVLRAAQFAARFGFRTAGETIELCRKTDLSALSKERIEGELKKALLKSDHPSEFFRLLREMDQLETWFPEMQQLIGLEQDPKFHPEGDVWTHTLEVLDRAVGFRGEVSDPYAFLLLALTHDFGKITTTEFVNGRIHAYGHETEGLPLIRDFLNRITGEISVKKYVMNMVPLHMKPNVAAHCRPAVKSTNKMFDQALAPKDLIWFSMSDKPVLAGDEAFTGDNAFLFERFHIYGEYMSRPYVTGKDLIEAGLKPGEYFSDVLAYSHKLRLAGTEKASALKQTLSYAKQYLK